MQLLLLTLASIVALSCANLGRLGYEYPRPTQTFDDIGQQPPTIVADRPLVLADEPSDISNDVAVTEAAAKEMDAVSPGAQPFANPYYNNNGAFPFGPQSNFVAPFPNQPAQGFQGSQPFAPNFPPSGYGPSPFAAQPNFPAPYPNYPQQQLPQGFPPGYGAGNGFPPAQSFPAQFYPSQNVPNGGFANAVVGPNAGFPFGPAQFPFQENAPGFDAGAFARGKRRT